MKSEILVAMGTQLLRGPTLPREALLWARSAIEKCESAEDFQRFAQSEGALRTWPAISERLSQLEAVRERLKKLAEVGIEPITILDRHYPDRWRERLGDSSPLAVFASGNFELLQGASLGIVGSRDASSEAIEFARSAGENAARTGHAVVSGAARGIDEAAMNGAIEAGGSALGIVSDSLERIVKMSGEQSWLASGRAVLVSPYAPDAPFSTGNAMGRNKFIYAHSEATIVASCSEGEGGTWTGAVEALRKRWCRVLSWTGEGAPAGNETLLRKGAEPIENAKQIERALVAPARNALFDV